MFCILVQPIYVLRETLKTLADSDHYLFTSDDFSSLFPKTETGTLRVLLGRAVKAGFLRRVCRGVYLYPKVTYPRGLELYHVAAKLRSERFCYLSLESVLCEAGIISQIPLNWITLMTGGRSGIIKCGQWGTIEFIHTKRNFDTLSSRLSYDPRLRLWRARPGLALADMRAAKRPLDLIDREAAKEAGLYDEFA
jgi:hypothetical protein